MAQLQSCSGLIRVLNPSLRQQRTVLRAFKPAARCRPASAEHLSSHAEDHQTVSTSTCSTHLHPTWSQLAPAAVALAPFLVTSAAWADDLDVYAAASDAGGPTEFVVTAMATTVFGLLLLVTLGVGYLTLVSWLDSRQEKKDQETPVLKSSAASSTAAAVEEEQERKRVRVKREKRGFGGN